MRERMCVVFRHGIGAGVLCTEDAPARKPKSSRKSGARSPSPAAAGAGQSVSYMDRLQKDAHASELDHTNTVPETFYLLMMIQVRKL